VKSRLGPAAALAALTLLAGCGGGGGAGGHQVAAPQQRAATTASASAPSGWRLARAPSGATLAYPASWRPLAGDPGTLSAVQRDGTGHVVGYLNLTPRQGSERAANWVSFRPAHEREEGDRDVRVIAASSERLPAGAGTCLRDSYTTITHARYVELACLVEGPHPAVVLGAAPPQQWTAQEPVIARAIAAARP
jgi:hypothetical protein